MDSAELATLKKIEKHLSSIAKSLSDISKHEVRQDKKKFIAPMTVRQYVEKMYPKQVSNNCDGGIYDCPGDYVSGMITQNCDLCHMHGNAVCTYCFDQFIPIDAVDAKTGKCVYPMDATFKLDELS